MRNVEEKLQALGATTPERRKAHFVSALCVAWPDGETRIMRAGSMARSSGRRAAAAASAMIRCSCPRATRKPSARWNPAPSMRSRIARAPSRSWSMPSSDGDSRSMCIGRSARPNAPIAISIRMCAMSRVDTQGFADALASELAWFAAASTGRRSDQHLLRRRHAVADAAGERRDGARHRSPRCGLSQPMPR